MDRLGVSGGPPSLIARPFRAPEKSTIPLLGRDEQIIEAYAAANSPRPIEFTATCGYGKTTLLRHIAAHTGYDGVARSSVYLRAGPGGLHDLLQRLVAELFTSDPPVKPTPEQCAGLLGQVGAVIVLNNVMLDPEPGRLPPSRAARLQPGARLPPARPGRGSAPPAYSPGYPTTRPSN